MKNSPLFLRRTVKSEKAGWTKDQLDKVNFPELGECLVENRRSDSLPTMVGFDCLEFESMRDVREAFSAISNHHVSIDSTEMAEYKMGVHTTPTLFLDFADLNVADKKSVQRFINQFGLLFPDNRDSVDPKNHNQEPLAAWIYFQLELKNLIHIWRQFIYRREESEPILFNEIDRKMTNFRFNNKNAYVDFPGINLIRPREVEKLDDQDAYEFIANTFQQKLDRLIGLTAPTHNIAGLKQMDAPLMGSLASFAQYGSFFGAVLYQLVDAIEQDKTFIRCLECGSWMEPSNKGKIYDTASCKASAGRRRRELSLLFEVVDNFGDLISKSLKEHFRIVNSGNSENAAQKLFDFWEEKGVKKELRKRLLDLLFNTHTCLNIGAKGELIVDHLGLGQEAAELMKGLELATFATLRPEFQTAYYDWSWGINAFESDPVKQGIGSLLLD